MRGSKRAAGVAVALAVGCGGSPPPGVTHADALMARSAPDVAEGRDEATGEGASRAIVLRDLVAALRYETCAVRRVVATREATFDVATELEIAALDDVARSLCEAGVHTTDTDWGADGTVAVAPPSGPVRPGYVFAFPDFEAESVSGRARADAPIAACGGRVSDAPDLVVYPVDQTASLSVSSDEDVFLWVRGPDGTDLCTNLNGRDGLNGLGEGRHEVRVGVLDGGQDATWTLDVSPPQERQVVGQRWVIGTYWSRQFNVGPYSRPAPDDGSYYCSGYIGDAPSLRVTVPTAGEAEVTVTSGSDPVLVMRGPDGELYCNDDYDGLNPGFYMWFEPGVWEIWIGSFGMGSEFSATIHFD